MDYKKWTEMEKKKTYKRKKVGFIKFFFNYWWKQFGLVFPATLIGIPAIIIGLIHKPYAIYGVFGALAFIGSFLKQ